MNHPLFKHAFWVLLLVGVLHNAAMTFYIYWTLWWFDMLVHFLGGMWVGLVALWLYEMPEIRKKIGDGRAFSVSVSTAFFVSVLWEIHEYAFDIAGVASEQYVTDTLIDFIMAVLGSMLAVLYAARVIRKHFHGRA